MIRRLANRYRLSIINDESFQERFSLRLTPWNVILILLALFVVSGGLVYTLVAFTSLREVVIPGYLSESYRDDARNSRAQVDSLQAVCDRQNRYIHDLGIVLGGGTLNQAPTDSSSRPGSGSDLDFNLLEEDSLLRERVDQEPALGLNFDSGQASSLANLLFFKPLDGTMSGAYDATIDHFGVDIVAPQNSAVKSVAEGTVFFAGFTIDGGHEIHVQHKHNVVSVYKHNSKLLAAIGDRVDVGQSIAIIGNTGGHTDGPHLHFELWIEGVPVNPEDFLSFD